MNMNNVLDNSFVSHIYDSISILNDCTVRCEFEDVSMLVYKSTDIVEVRTCQRLALEALAILVDAGLVVYDNGYKVLPAL